MKSLLIPLVLLLLQTCLLTAAPTAMKEWKSSTGTKMTASALNVDNGIVVLKTADNRELKVPLDKLSPDDIKFLRTHFNIAEPGAIPAAPSVIMEDGLKWPLGTISGPVTAAPGSSFLIYLPKNLPKGRKHPLLMVLSPTGGAPGHLNRYIPGAERNGWILIMSVESSNDTDAKSVVPAIQYVTKNLPVDPARIYLGGFSGGSSRSFDVAPQVKAAGVISCGMGACGASMDRKLVVYSLSGTQCWNRDNSAKTLTELGPRSSDSLMRFFVGNHAWAGPEYMEDAITHLNGVFLAKNRQDHAEEAYQNDASILRFAEKLKPSAPARALMWTTFLTDQKVDTRLSSPLAKLHAELRQNAAACQYVDGLQAIHQVSIKVIGKTGCASAAPQLRKLLQEYSGTAWQAVIEKLLEPTNRLM